MKLAEGKNKMMGKEALVGTSRANDRGQNVPKKCQVRTDRTETRKQRRGRERRWEKEREKSGIENQQPLVGRGKKVTTSPKRRPEGKRRRTVERQRIGSWSRQKRDYGKRRFFKHPIINPIQTLILLLSLSSLNFFRII
jgi:hypothetical protein